MGLRIPSCAVLLMVVCVAGARAQQVDWGAVDQAMDRGGAMQAGGVHKYSMLRSDLHVTVQGVDVKPGVACIAHSQTRGRGRRSAGPIAPGSRT